MVIEVCYLLTSIMIEIFLCEKCGKLDLKDTPPPSFTNSLGRAIISPFPPANATKQRGRDSPL